MNGPRIVTTALTIGAYLVLSTLVVLAFEWVR